MGVRMDDVGEVGFALAGQGRRHADDDRVGLGNAREIARGGKAAGLPQY